MNSMAVRFVVVVAAAVLVASGLIGAAPTRARAAGSQADAAVLEVCRFLPFSADPATRGTLKTVFAVRVANVGSTVSDGPVLAGVNQPGRQKGPLLAATPGPLEPGQRARFKLEARELIPGMEITIIAVFDRRTNPAETPENNMTFSDPLAIPAC